MSFDGGFGAVVYVREGLINQVLKAMHFRHGDAFRVSFSQTLTLDGASVIVSGAFYVEAPHVTLRAADQKVRLALSGWARVRLQAEGSDEACLARLTAQLLVPIALDTVTQKWDEQLFLDLSQFDVASATVEIPWISVLPGVHAPALALSAEFRQLLLNAVRPMAQKVLRVNVPLSMVDQMEMKLLISQQVFFFPRIRPAGVKVMDGALAAGFDLITGPTHETAGDMNALEQPWAAWAAGMTAELASTGGNLAFHPEDSQVVVAILPAMLLKFGGPNIELQVKLRALTFFPEDKRVDEVSLGLVPGAATLLLKITDINDDPFPDGKIELRIFLIPFGSFIHLLRTDVVFSTGGLVGLIDDLTGLATDYVRAVAKDRIGGAVREANWIFAMAKFFGDLPGAAGSPGLAKVRVQHAGTVIDPGFVLAGISAEVIPVHNRNDNGVLSGLVDDPDVLPAFGLTAVTKHGMVPFRSRDVRFDVPDHPTLRRDPSIRILWSVLIHRQDGTKGTFSQDRWSDEAGGRTLTIDLWSEEFYLTDRLEVRCVHYRPPHDELTVSEGAIPVSDRFRRDFAFVRWHRDISWTAIEDGKEVHNSKRRSSAVHKTDIRQRCQFCDTGINDSRVVGSDGMQHFMELPPVSQEGFRVKLCEFCFR